MKLTLAIMLVVIGLAMAASLDTEREREKENSRRAINVESEKENSRRAIKGESEKEAARRAVQEEREKSEERREIEKLARHLAKEEQRRETEEREREEERRDEKETDKEERRRELKTKSKSKEEERRELLEKEAEKERREIASGSGEFRWETIPIAENASQCIFSPETRSISCRGMSGLVECPASVEVPKDVKVEVFGMRRHPVKSMVSSVEKRIYELYPRKLDNSSYLNFTVKVDEKPVELYLFFSETSGDMSGVRISDKKCYMRLVKVVLSQATAQHEVKVDGTELSVDLFGEILNAEKPTNKRWLGFGWPWLWGMGLWGWGLGWGLPFWG